MVCEKHIISTEKEIMKKKKHFVKNKTIKHYVLKCSKYPHCLIYKMNY